MLNSPVLNKDGTLTDEWSRFLQQAVENFNRLVRIGAGDPNGVVTASPPAIFLNLAGGASTTLWVKESGAETNTGWVGK